MTNPDFIHSTHQIAYERRSAAEEALKRALPLDAAVQMLATSDRPSYVLIKSGASRSAWHGICHQTSPASTLRVGQGSEKSELKPVAAQAIRKVNVT